VRGFVKGVPSMFHWVKTEEPKIEAEGRGQVVLGEGQQGGMGSVDDIEKHAPHHMYIYLAERGRSPLKGVVINRREPQNPQIWERWSSVRPFRTGCVADPLKQEPSPYVTMSNLVVLRQRVLHVRINA